MNRSIGFSQPIIPNPCHFPRYSQEPKIKSQGFREKWDPVSRRLVRMDSCYIPPPPPHIPELYITTIAGNGVSTTLNRPSSVSFDSAGNLYIADSSNNRVRKMSTNGTITTIAGTGVAGDSGDGGLATDARLNDPSSVCFDSAGNLYIADRSNNRIRKVDTNGTITTFAGTGASGYSGDGSLATSAQLKNPSSVYFDLVGNLYIADSSNYRVRKVSTNGTITTIAGTGVAGDSGDGGLATAAQLDFPFGMTLDLAGNLYITDFVRHRIRKVNTNGIITTIAGTGVAGDSGDEGPATSAQINNPSSVCFDSAGNLYIADRSNNRIRKVDTNGTITTFAGTGAPGYSGDGGLAKDAQLNAPISVCFDSANNLYIADSLNNRIRKLYYV